VKGLLRKKRPPATGRKILYLHVGHYKTGTSALQLMLDDNRAALAGAGLDYLAYGCSFSKHSRFAFSILQAEGVDTLLHGYNNPHSPEDLWSGMFDAVRASAQPTCLISTEEFIRIGAWPQACDRLARVARLGDDIDIRVLVYLRPPESHLQSWYNQLVKMGQPVPAYEAAVCSVMEPVHYDYALALKPWIDTFGAGAVCVRAYDDDLRRDNGLYRDFLSVFGIDFDALQLTLPGEDPNPRLDARKLDLLRLMQNADMTEHTLVWAQKRADAYLEREHSLAYPQAVPDFDAVTARAAAGLAVLEGMPGSTVDLDRFRHALPRPHPTSEAELTRLVGFLLAELRHLRQQANSGSAELRARLEALEKRLDDGA
jgi:hypothetical protein